MHCRLPCDPRWSVIEMPLIAAPRLEGGLATPRLLPVLHIPSKRDLVRGGFQLRLPTSLPPPGQQQQPSPLPRRQPVPLMPPAQLHTGAPPVVAPAPAVPLQSPPPSELMDVDPSAGPPSQAVAVQPVLQPVSLDTPKESDTAAPCPAPTQQPSTQLGAIEAANSRRECCEASAVERTRNTEISSGICCVGVLYPRPPALPALPLLSRYWPPCPARRSGGRRARKNVRAPPQAPIVSSRTDSARAA
ncbi:YLP motif-containing protein 1-like [Schistocerca serialis cubense]|uniref:YLP motif-containing protein 1-like n=1 Tax=Schistocerca serialis cubense TaxID=2023355 RepID=UPI00214EDAD0|nr:YLP motif-containing protein 1-like [Schistocerca serialis cubense]